MSTSQPATGGSLVELVSPDDLKIPQVLPDGPAIVQAIREHHAQWKARQG